MLTFKAWGEGAHCALNKEQRNQGLKERKSKLSIDFLIELFGVLVMNTWTKLDKRLLKSGYLFKVMNESET